MTAPVALAPAVLGFSGTRHGLTGPQLASLAALLRSLAPPAECHHGCCAGADVEFHRLARRLWPAARLVGHPCDLPSWRVRLADLTEECLIAPPAARNRAIAGASDVLVACPDGPRRARSGTWMTVAFAERLGRPVWLVMPDGAAPPAPPARAAGYLPEPWRMGT